MTAENHEGGHYGEEGCGVSAYVHHTVRCPEAVVPDRAIGAELHRDILASMIIDR